MLYMSLALFFDESVIGPWVCERTGASWNSGRGTAIGKLRDGKLVAGALYEDWNGSNITCHIAGDAGWADATFLSVIFDYPFNAIGAKMITAPVCSSNEKSIALVTKFGFNLEAKLHGATSKGDLLLFTMRKNECKYLRGKYGKKLQSTTTT